MKTIFQHIEHIKGKPHHVRKRVAFAAATVSTGLIALVWLIGSLSLGKFAIAGSSFADSTGQQGVTTAGSDTSSPNFAGVASAIPAASAPAHIEIVDTASSTTGTKKAEQTVIPF